MDHLGAIFFSWKILIHWYKYTMYWELLVEIMDSELAGIALFTEGRSPEVNGAIPATEESVISLVARNSAWYICFISFIN